MNGGGRRPGGLSQWVLSSPPFDRDWRSYSPDTTESEGVCIESVRGL